MPPDLPDSFDISNLEYNPDTRWFTAKLSAPSAENAHTQRTLSGKVETLTDVPTLKDTLRNGDIISRHDIKMVAVPSRSLNHDTVLHPEDLYGLTPRRIVSPGTPIKENDIQAPQIVSRGDTITMIYNHHGLLLTSLGRALQDGAKGDAIRIVNNQSKKTLQGIVTGEQEVTLNVF